MSDRVILEEIWWAGVKRVQGGGCVKEALEQSDFRPTHVAAVGKAASSMMRAALDVCGTHLPSLVVTKYGHAEKQLGQYPNLAVIEAAHPVPDQHSLYGGKALLDFVSGIDDGGRLLLLVSGGASALAEVLPNHVSLEDLKSLNEKMLAEGHDIHAINKQRKEMSRIKGGKLLSHFFGRSARVLAISDVEGDDIAVIGSGIGQLPAIRQCHDMAVTLVASNAIARLACEEAAKDRDIEVIVNTENLCDDIHDVARSNVETVRLGAPGLYVFGGEPTTLLPKNPGEGGRNQALAVALAKELSGLEGFSVLVAGTDGSDGPTDLPADLSPVKVGQKHPADKIRWIVLTAEPGSGGAAGSL